jgi:hypothetical protein
MRIAVVLFLLGLVAASSEDGARVHVGKLLAVSHTGIELSRNESILSIGFVGDPEAIAELDGLKVGDEVRAVFGTTTPPGESRRINKLLSIRRCIQNDQQCAADRKVEEAKDAEAEKARALSEAEVAQCRSEMEDSLLDDARYAPQTTKVPKIQSQESLRQVNALTGKRQECATAVMRDHQNAVLEACQLHRCGDHIGGGCSHIAGYSLSDAVIERALLVCKDK